MVILTSKLVIKKKLKINIKKFKNESQRVFKEFYFYL